MDSQLDRVSAWRKFHRKRLAIVGVDIVELALILVVDGTGMRVRDRTVSGEPRPDVGWATRDDERPLSRRELAAMVRLPGGADGLARLDAAIASLVELGHLVVGDDGAVGSTGWEELQETPDESRKRAARRRRAGQSSDRPAAGRDNDRITSGQSADSPPQKTEDRRQKTDSELSPSAGAGARPLGSETLGERLKLTRVAWGWNEALTSRRTGIPVGTIRDFEADRAIPCRAELAQLALHLGAPELEQADVADLDQDVVDAVVLLEAQAREALKLDPIPRTAGAPDVARLVHSTGEDDQTLANWAIAIRRQREDVQRQLDRGDHRGVDFLRIETLAKPKTRARLLADAGLDVRRPAPARGRGRDRGPAPPSNPDRLPPEVRRG
jgi:transcriptional regulator with XRE-family HTH domain